MNLRLVTPPTRAEAVAQAARLAVLRERGRRALRAQIFLMLLIPYTPRIAPGAYRWDRALAAAESLVILGLGGLGLGLALAGLVGLVRVRGLTPRAEPAAGAELQERGVYRYLRNPLYAGLVLMGAAWGAWHDSPLTFLGVATLAAVLNEKARIEEALLLDRFGERYRAYCGRTGRFLPRF
jgi:protein-S-isoprenylcysteine O-methyltransferase Ste14